MSEAFAKQHRTRERPTLGISRLSLLSQLAKLCKLVQSWFRSGYSLFEYSAEWSDSRDAGRNDSRRKSQNKRIAYVLVMNRKGI